MKCPKCDTENPDTQSFCGDCGTQLPVSEETPIPTKTLETPREEQKRESVFAGKYEIIEELGKGGMETGMKYCMTIIKRRRQNVFPKY